MSDFTTGRDIRDDLAPVPEADRLAEANARGEMAGEAQSAQRAEVSGTTEALSPQYTGAPWYLDERGHIRDPGTGVIIATLVDPGGMIPNNEQMANGRLIERARLLHAAAARALDYLTDHGIDLDGPEEEVVAGIRADLDEALGNDLPRHTPSERAPLPDIEPEHVPEGPQTPTHDFVDTITAQIDAAQTVIDNWSSGDLAGAVNGLEQITEAARATLQAASSERPATEADRQPDLPLDLPADESREVLQDSYAQAERLERMRTDDISAAEIPAEADALAKAERAAAPMDKMRT